MTLFLLDMAGTFAFALSGGLRGVERRFDLFGVVFLAYVASVSGGVLRDLLIGAAPPAAIVDWRYAALAVSAGVICYFFYAAVARLAHHIAVMDAIGLGLFAALGAEKALNFGLSPPMAALLGLITGIGGGMARDILTMRAPMVLHKDFYALAALAGAALTAAAAHVGTPAAAATTLGAALTTGLRLTAMRENWRLPPARPR